MRAGEARGDTPAQSIQSSGEARGVMGVRKAREDKYCREVMLIVRLCLIIGK